MTSAQSCIIAASVQGTEECSQKRQEADNSIIEEQKHYE